MAFVVKEIKNGKFYMQTPDGKIVELKPGMHIIPNSIVFGADSNSINSELIISGGKEPIVIKGFETLVFDITMFENNEVAVEKEQPSHTQTNQPQAQHEVPKEIKKEVQTAQTQEAPENMATAAGPNQPTAGIDVLEADFANINPTFNEVNIDLNLNITTPIVTTIMNEGNVVIQAPQNEIISEFVGNLVNDTAAVYESGLPLGTQSGKMPTTIEGNIFGNDTLLGGVTILNVNGITPNAEGIIQITTPEGNIFTLNVNTGDYTYKLIHPLTDIVDGNPVDSLTQNFEVTLEDNFGHISSETISINIIDDKPVIVGEDVDIGMSGTNIPKILADIDISSDVLKSLNSNLENITPDTFAQLKNLLTQNLSSIFGAIGDTIALENENQSYLNLMLQIKDKMVNYIDNIVMKNAGESVTIIDPNDGSENEYTVKDGDILYDRGNDTYLLVANIQTKYVNSDVLDIVREKIDNFLDNYSDVIPNTNALKTYADLLLTESGINTLKNAIINDQFETHIKINGMELDDGRLQINTIGVDIQIGDNHLTQDMVLADPAKLVNNIEISGKLYDWFGNEGVLYGADLGHIESIKIGEDVYNFDANNPIQTIPTQYGDLVVNFITADVTLKYNGNPNVAESLDIKLPVNVTIVDNDNDTISKDINLYFGINEQLPVIPNHIANIDLGAGDDIIAPVDTNHMPESLKLVATLLGTEISNDIDFSKNVDNVKNIEFIELSKIDNANIDNLTLDDILNMTDNRNHLAIIGDDDSVNKINTEGWTKVEERHDTMNLDGTQENVTTYVYTNGENYVALTVNDQIDNTGL